MKIALIQDNVVVSIVDATDDTIAEISAKYQNAIDITDFNPMPDVGWILRGNQLIGNGKHEKSKDMRITRIAFRNRFTHDEHELIYEAKLSDVDLQIMHDNLLVSDFVDLSDQKTIKDIKELAKLKLISNNRADNILNEIPKDHERYTKP